MMPALPHPGTRTLISGFIRDDLEHARADGFPSIERFESLSEPGKPLSLSFRRDAAAGRGGVFADYRLRVAHVVRDDGPQDRWRAVQCP
jgi:hypothetical protein